jgi:hypothetical protein
MAAVIELIGNAGSHHDSTIFFKPEIGSGQDFRID